jgi:hypothetical protein
MSSCVVFEVDIWIKRKKFTNPVNMIQEINENIIRINFIHAHKLTYDVIAQQVKFTGAGFNSITTLKNIFLPAMTSTIVKAKFKGHQKAQATSMANICPPRTPMVLGIPSIVNVCDNNICNIVLENCTPYDDNICNIILENCTTYDVTLEWDDHGSCKSLSLMISFHQYARTSTAIFQK